MKKLLLLSGIALAWAIAPASAADETFVSRCSKRLMQ